MKPTLSRLSFTVTRFSSPSVSAASRHAVLADANRHIYESLHKNHRKNCMKMRMFVAAAAWFAAGLLASAPVFANPITFELAPYTFRGGADGPVTTSGTYDNFDAYTVNGHLARVDLMQLTTVAITETSSDFLLLQSLFATATTGWGFTVSSSTLPDASLVVHTYDAQYDGSVGADFHVEYRPPSGLHVNVHWIQIVNNNHALGAGHGTVDYKVDSGTGSPYYDDGGMATDTWFLDRPRRADVDMDHWWSANLYLVTGPDPNEVNVNEPANVTIYNTGIHWGWVNNAPDSSTTFGLLLVACSVLLLLRKTVTRVRPEPTTHRSRR